MRVTEFMANSDWHYWQCWSRFSIGVYGSKSYVSLPFVKCSSNVQTVGASNSFVFAPKYQLGQLYFDKT